MALKWFSISPLKNHPAFLNPHSCASWSLTEDCRKWNISICLSSSFLYLRAELFALRGSIFCLKWIGNNSSFCDERPLKLFFHPALCSYFLRFVCPWSHCASLNKPLRCTLRPVCTVSYMSHNAWDKWDSNINTYTHCKASLYTKNTESLRG